MAERNKKRWIILSSFFILFLFYVEKRSFYCLENGKCVTVWYRNNDCYVIPYKYSGLFLPEDNYIKIKTGTTGAETDIDVFWSDSLPKNVFFGVSPNNALIQVMNRSKEKIILSNIYMSDEEYSFRLIHGEDVTILKKEYRNILYDENAKKASEVKRNVSYIWIGITYKHLSSKKSSFDGDCVPARSFQLQKQ